MVRDILSDMDSDDVESINDTVEAKQVAQIIKTSYFNLMSNREWPHLQEVTQVHHSGTPERPTHLKLPESIKELKYLAYNKAKADTGRIEYQEIRYVYPDEFLRISSGRNSTTKYSKVVEDVKGTPFTVVTNKAPDYWTSFDDEYIVCDSYDSEVDDALQKSKSQVIITRMPKWEHLDDSVPDLPAEAFMALLEDAKSAAFFNLKQMANERTEIRARRQQTWLARKAWQAHGGVRYPNYGRRGKK